MKSGGGHVPGRAKIGTACSPIHARTTVLAALLSKKRHVIHAQMLALHSILQKVSQRASSITLIFPPVRAPPGRGGVSRCLSKVLRQVRLIAEPAAQRDMAQGFFGLQHVLSRQLDAPPDHEGMRGLAECAPKGA
jgi:hypothetical protein